MMNDFNSLAERLGRLASLCLSTVYCRVRKGGYSRISCLLVDGSLQHWYFDVQGQQVEYVHWSAPSLHGHRRRKLTTSDGLKRTNVLIGREPK